MHQKNTVETGTRIRRQFRGADFRQVCHRHNVDARRRLNGLIMYEEPFREYS